MKNVPAVKWPASPAHVGAFGPLAGRNDHGDGMPPVATRTPSADELPEPEEVISDESQQGPQEGDC